MGRRYLKRFLLLCLGMALALLPGAVLASGGSTCLTAPAAGANGGVSCDNCISSFMYQNINEGGQIITSMFNTINTVLQNIEYSFFNGIVGNTTFQTVMGTAFVLYVVIFGIMIMFNITSYRIGEIFDRLIKVSIVFMLTSPGAWAAFNTYVQNPTIGAMNQTIREFTVVAETGGSSPTVTMLSGTGTAVSASGAVPTGGLDPVMFSNMFGSSLTTVFSVQMFAAITATARTGFFGWLLAIFLVWALIEFFLMMLGALVTYAKAIIGLAFLFGIAPLFFIFLLFESTRQIFLAWVSHILTFALQPVLLFSFLAFYVALVNDAVPYLFTDSSGNFVDYCWTKWFSMPGTLWDSYMWSPTISGGQSVQSHVDASGNVLKENVNVPNAIYFLMLCHLAQTFTRYIETLSQEIGEGIGGGVASGEQIRQDFGDLIRKLRGK